MLANSSKKMLFDAHFHYFYCQNQGNFDFCGCSSAHSKEEWFCQQKVTEKNKNFKLSFGIHPQIAGNEDVNELLIFLEMLAKTNQLDAVGETGFDFFTEELKSSSEKQEKVFQEQIKLAKIYRLPVIIHCRKANDKLFEYSSELKKVPAVLFHSFMGTSVEAMSLLKRGINGFFSFGKQVLNNNKKVIECVKELPVQNLLCETDAPYQFLKGETETKASEIERVYKAFSDYKNCNLEELVSQFSQNYSNLFIK